MRFEAPAFVVAATYRCKQGSGADVAHLLREVAAHSRSEPGCMLYIAHQAIDEPDTVFLYEQYVDEAAYESHRSTPHFRAIVEAQIVPRLVHRTRTFFRTID